MKPKIIRRDQASLFSSFEDQLDHNNPLFKLAHLIDWQMFEREFTPLYSSKPSRPAKPIRLMVGLLILKHVRNLSDESVVGEWSENSYFQYFCAYTSFVPNVPCNPTELVHFRHRIKEVGIELILKESIRVNQEHNDKDKNGGGTAFIDTTVQEGTSKNSLLKLITHFTPSSKFQKESNSPTISHFLKFQIRYKLN